MHGKTINGTYFHDQGQGPSVVLAHGLGMNHAMWQWQVPALLPSFRVVTYDLIGHGGSPSPSGKPDLTLLSRQLLELMDHREIERAAIVGFSLGGMIARRFAIDHLERLSALAILHSAHGRSDQQRNAVHRRVDLADRNGPAATVDEALERWFTPRFAADNPDILTLVRGWILANDRRIYPLLYRVLAEGDQEIVGNLGTITCPTLVMTGEEDHGNSPEMARQMALAIADAKVVILPGLRHMALAEDPPSVNGPLLEFLRAALLEP